MSTPDDNNPSHGDTATEPTNSEPQARADGVTREELKAILSEFRDGIFANVRRSIGFGKAGKETEPQSTQPPPQRQDSGDDRQRERAFLRATLPLGLTPSQFDRMAKSFDLERPDDPQEWVAGYARDTGLQRNDVTNATTTQPKHGSPASNVGGPPPSRTITDDANIFELSEADRAHLLKTKGPKWFKDKVFKDARGMRVKIRNA